MSLFKKLKIENETIINNNNNNKSDVLPSFDPRLIPQEVWVDLILDNDFSFHELFQFGLVCRFFSELLQKPQIQNLKFTKKKTGAYLGHNSDISEACWSPDGVFLASCSTIRIWNTRTGREINKFDHKEAFANNEEEETHFDEIYIYSVDFNPSGNLLASGHMEGIVIFDLLTNQPKLVIANKRSIFYVRFHPNGKVIASCGSENEVSLWDAEDGRLIDEFEGHEKVVSQIAFDSTGDFLVSCCFFENQRVIVFEVATGLHKWSKRFDGKVWDLSLSPDNRVLAVVVRDSGSTEIQVFDFSTFEMKKKISFHDAMIVSLDLNSNFFFYSCHHEIFVCDLVDDQQKMKLEGHTADINQVVLSPDGNYLASCSEDNSIRVWSLKTLQKKEKTLTFL